MIKSTPPMGWNSWNTFGADINEQLIRDTADKMVDTGLLNAGYEYLVIDDCWSLKERDENGRLAANPEKFPNGMKAVADYVHSKGLKFGMYSCAGNLTCAGYPGSFEHEFTDAETFAEWGVDFLKYDYCYHSNIIHGKYLYRRMGTALKNCGRDILFSACSWGADNTAEWMRETGADMWRSTMDIFDTWESIKKLTEQQESIFAYGGKGCFNDMDMLVVGMYGKGNVAVSGCTYSKFANDDAQSDSEHSKFGDAKEDGTFDVEDLAMGFIRFDNGACLQIEFSWASNIEGETRFVELRGTKAGITWCDNGDAKIYSEENGKLVNTVRSGGMGNGHDEALRHFTRIVLDGAAPDYVPEQGLNMIKILEAIYKSAETGREVVL